MINFRPNLEKKITVFKIRVSIARYLKTVLKLL